MATEICFGDNVRIRRSLETERLGIAETIGNVYGETPPSVTNVEVIGQPRSDYAFNVYFDSLQKSYWLVPEMLEFVEHAPGTEVHVHGAPFKSVRQRDGTWKDVPLEPVSGSDQVITLREALTDAMRYWEPRRVIYNLVLVAVVAIHAVRLWLSSELTVTADTFLWLIIIAVLANVAYCAAYLADVPAQLSGFRSEWLRIRLAVFLVGLAFSAILAHYFSMAIFWPAI
jgi:hypothetical protein